MSKVLLILSDGLRPDGFLACGNPYVEELLAKSAHDLAATTVMPSVTLPCHMSLFHSVKPDRHGILTNTYVPQVRPVKGLCDVLRASRKKNAFFYNWEELRDLARPDAMAHSYFCSGHIYGYEEANQRVTDACIDCIKRDAPDFVFLYLGWTDGAGHGFGWMSDEYLRAARESVGCIKRVLDVLPDDYKVVITADHGGHDRGHGSDLPEDMTIPVLILDGGPERELHGVSIIDLAPTIASMLGVEADEDWEGKIIDL